MPIFEYVKDQKFDDPKKSKDFEFSDWKNNLKISLKENAILNIAYKDANKELINPVLERFLMLIKLTLEGIKKGPFY